MTVALSKGAHRVLAGSDNGTAPVSVPRDDARGHRVSIPSSNGKVTVRTTN
ncbi:MULTISPECIES: hypothetical protein [Streptomyces]|uniref:hypothetical protein n=1 Tax=Streptomyces TaxID=1883 RepID=UPI00131D783C|nr:MULTISPECIES: hypothetical protein [Streptomyces]MCH0559945.1 hypothetical protein [Streptomyces sp. MUM 16J]